ncbi:MAG TPA: hypothetical protein VMM13_11320, partial [Euzebya sp.]|nr:hypothetical protein [Euzebya sp.]
VHVLAVIAWVGGGITLTLVAGRAARLEGNALAPVARIGASLGGYFGAVSGVAFLAGVAMMFTEEAPGWDQAWISIGLAVWFISAFLGARMISPRYVKLADAAEAGDGAAVTAARKSLTPIAMTDLTLLAIAVAAMVFQWGSR